MAMVILNVAIDRIFLRLSIAFLLVNRFSTSELAATEQIDWSSKLVSAADWSSVLKFDRLKFDWLNLSSFFERKAFDRVIRALRDNGLNSVTFS